MLTGNKARALLNTFLNSRSYYVWFFIVCFAGFCVILSRTNRMQMCVNNVTKHNPPILSSVTPSFRSLVDDDRINTKTEVDRKFLDYLTYSLRETAYAGAENYTQYYLARFGLKELENIRPIEPNLGKVINDYTSFQYPINIQSCSSRINQNNKSSIFIAVVSGPNYFDKRQAIRETWKLHLENNFVKSLIDVAGVGFFIGTSDDNRTKETINQEARQHNDIIQVNIVDSYKNLTLKTVSVLNWVVNFCPRVNFVLKVDDDHFINLRNLAATIRSLPISEKRIYGKAIGGNVPLRSGEKWAHSYDNWPWSHLPMYVQGGGYIISGNAVGPLLASAQTTPFFVSEDFYISGLCNRKVNVSIYDSPNLVVSFLPAGAPNSCFVQQTTIWGSQATSSAMKESYDLVEQFYGNVVTCQVDKIANSGTQKTADDPARFVASSFQLVETAN